MTRFIFLTKTRWDEPPRIRHQLATLLAGAGHEVLFFEKPAPVWRRLQSLRSGAAGITLAQHHELVHHKLRLLPFVHRLNAAFVARSLRHALRAAGSCDDAVIVNFNYDYWFLRTLFPRQRLVTMINDDFVSSALFGFEWPLRWALERTCRSSDRVLTVSASLQSKLSQFCSAELFLPWADRPYVGPEGGTARNLLLFWGFINKKIDFDLLQALARQLARTRPDLKLLLVGPVEQGVGSQLEVLRANTNVEVLPSTPLAQLPLPRVLAALIPYRNGIAEFDVIELPNKALQLLARGLPLLISGMPNFIHKPFVFRLGGAPATQVVEDIEVRFDALQADIRAFVADNSESMRLAQFLSLAA